MRFKLPSDIYKKHKGVFITGTDTCAGKTTAACLIAKQVKAGGIRCGVMKPVSAGDRTDALALKKAVSADDALNDINPVFFNRPLAPFTAQRYERKRVNIPLILRAYARLLLKYDFLVVEGAGGLLVPLNRNFYMSDLAYSMRLPVIVVARPGLGTINHTLLTVQCARQYGLHTAGFIINYTSPPKKNISEKTNPHIISRFGRIRFLGTIPYNIKQIYGK